MLGVNQGINPSTLIIQTNPSGEKKTTRSGWSSHLNFKWEVSNGSLSCCEALKTTMTLGVAEMHGLNIRRRRGRLSILKQLYFNPT